MCQIQVITKIGGMCDLIRDSLVERLFKVRKHGFLITKAGIMVEDGIWYIYIISLERPTPSSDS